VLEAHHGLVLFHEDGGLVEDVGAGRVEGLDHPHLRNRPWASAREGGHQIVAQVMEARQGKEAREVLGEAQVVAVDARLAREPQDAGLVALVDRGTRRLAKNA
jgi:hypothetical protein